MWLADFFLILPEQTQISWSGHSSSKINDDDSDDDDDDDDERSGPLCYASHC